MRIGQAGQNGRAMQIDRFHFCGTEFFRFVIRADKQNAIALDGDGFRMRLGVIAGVDVTVQENQIGGLI